MRSDPLDVPIALRIGRGTLRKMRQNLGWAVGYNVIALPIAAGGLSAAVRAGLETGNRGVVDVRIEFDRGGQRADA